MIFIAWTFLISHSPATGTWWPVSSVLPAMTLVAMSAIRIAVLALVIIGERAEPVPGHERIERAGGFRGAEEFGSFAFLGDLEFTAELIQLGGNLCFGDGFAELVQRAHFDEFKMISEHGGLLRHVAVNIEHPAITQ